MVCRRCPVWGDGAARSGQEPRAEGQREGGKEDPDLGLGLGAIHRMFVKYPKKKIEG